MTLMINSSGKDLTTTTHFPKSNKQLDVNQSKQSILNKLAGSNDGKQNTINEIRKEGGQAAQKTSMNLVAGEKA